MRPFQRIKALIGDHADARELFMHEKFNAVLVQVVKTVLGRYGEDAIAVETVWNAANTSDIAYTDNQKIHINLENALTQKLKKHEDRFLVCMGLLGHELGHVLFTDFNNVSKAANAWRNHSWYPYRPNSIYTEPFEKAFFSGKYNMAPLKQILASIYNITEDRYVNARISREFTGLFKNGIAAAQKIQWSDFLRYIPADERSLSGCINAMHYMLVNGPHERLLTQYPELSGLSSLPDIREINAPIDRDAVSNEIFLMFWPFIEEMLQEAEKNSESQSGNSGTDKAINEQSQRIQQHSQQGSGKGRTVERENSRSNTAQNQKNQNTSASGNTDSKTSASDAQNSDGEDVSDAQSGQSDSQADNQSNHQSKQSDTQSDGQSDANGDDASDDLSNDESDASCNTDVDDYTASVSELFDELLDSYAKEKARTNPEEIQELENQYHAEQVKGSAAHKNVRFKVNSFSVNDRMRDKYNTVYGRVRTISKKLQQDLLDVLEEQSNGTVVNGLLFGNRINPAATASNDGRIFRRKTMPGDEKELAVSILLDESGSMSGARIEKCLEMAILIEDFCRAVDVPLSVTGHRRDNCVEIDQFIDFNECSPNSRYKIANMYAGGCNRDGFALRYCVDKLKERTEPSRLMIIVSDGKPNDGNYGGAVAAKDIREVVEDCRRNNIALIAAAIGDDKDLIRNIYGDAFLDISNLQTLPRKMVSIIKKFLS